MTTIMMGKIEMELPDMYIMNRFIGTCLKGPRARSQHLLILRLGSASLEASACTKALPVELKPGGGGSSTFGLALDEKSNCQRGR